MAILSTKKRKKIYLLFRERKSINVSAVSWAVEFTFKYNRSSSITDRSLCPIKSDHCDYTRRKRDKYLRRLNQWRDIAWLIDSVCNVRFVSVNRLEIKYDTNSLFLFPSLECFLCFFFFNVLHIPDSFKIIHNIYRDTHTHTIHSRHFLLSETDVPPFADVC